MIICCKEFKCFLFNFIVFLLLDINYSILLNLLSYLSHNVLS